VVVGVLFCAALVLIGLSMRSRVEETRVLLKADRLTRTAGEVRPAN
jgi:hypothetical protein